MTHSYMRTESAKLARRAFKSVLCMTRTRRNTDARMAFDRGSYQHQPSLPTECIVSFRASAVGVASVVSIGGELLISW
jgi:hypothetical protein